MVGLSGEESPLQDAWATKLIRLLLFSEEVEEAAGWRTRRRSESERVEDELMGLSLHEQEEQDDEEEDKESFHSLDSRSSSASSSSSPSPSSSPTRQRQQQPFFSLTRTTPPHSTTCSSSLTTDIHLLAVLFPPTERHWIFCGDEFERLEEEEAEDTWEELNDDDDNGPQRSASPSKRDLKGRGSLPGGKEGSGGGGFLRCLHVDLQDFGLGELSFLPSLHTNRQSIEHVGF